MLSQLDQKKIKSKLKFVYRNLSTTKEIDFYHKEIIGIIKKFNKKKIQKKKTINEKTSVLICYGDSIYDNNKKKQFKFSKIFIKKN